jgi:hypothetical protein
MPLDEAYCYLLCCCTPPSVVEIPHWIKLIATFSVVAIFL